MWWVATQLGTLESGFSHRRPATPSRRNSGGTSGATYPEPWPSGVDLSATHNFIFTGDVAPFGELAQRLLGPDPGARCRDRLDELAAGETLRSHWSCSTLE